MKRFLSITIYFFLITFLQSQDLKRKSSVTIWGIQASYGYFLGNNMVIHAIAAYQRTEINKNYLQLFYEKFGTSSLLKKSFGGFIGGVSIKKYMYKRIWE